jgi:hypothetical protein
MFWRKKDSSVSEVPGYELSLIFSRGNDLSYRHSRPDRLLSYWVPGHTFFIARSIVAQSIKKFDTFVEPEDLLSCSQTPAFGPHPEPFK